MNAENFRQLIKILHDVAYSEGYELDRKMKLYFDIDRLDGETDEEFLYRADKIICGD